MRYSLGTRQVAAQLERHNLCFRLRFVRARSLVKTDPDEMINVCNGLLEEKDIEQSVRVGDVFALLVEFHTSKGLTDMCYPSFTPSHPHPCICSAITAISRQHPRIHILTSTTS